MLKERTNRDAPHDLRVATEAVARVDDDVEIADLLARLERLGETLRATGGGYEAAASRVVPAAQPFDHGIADRYTRAAAAWPAAPAPPSHERFAAALASLHAAADAARLASRRCDDARSAIDALGTAAIDR